MTARKRRSFGSVRQLPSGRWQARYTGPDLREYKGPSTFPTEDDAIVFLTEQRRKMDLGIWHAPGSELTAGQVPTLRAWAEHWLQGNQLTPRTRDLYESQLRRIILPDLGDVPINKITPQVVRRWWNSLNPETPRQNQQCYQLFRSVLQTAIDDDTGWITRNPCTIKKASKASRKRTFDLLSPAQVHAIADEMPNNTRLLVLLAAWCSLRFGEVSELRRGDFNKDLSALSVTRAVVQVRGEFIVGEPKTETGHRVVSIPPHLTDDIQGHLRAHVKRGKNALLFTAPDGGHLSNDRVRRQFNKACTTAGVERLRLHDLRHCGSTWAALAGATDAELMSRMGHTSKDMSLRYQQIARDRGSQLAARLSSLFEDAD